MKTLLDAEIALYKRKDELEITDDLIKLAFKLITKDYVFNGSVNDMVRFMEKELIRQYAEALNDPDFTEEDLAVENFYETVADACDAKFG